MDRIVSILKHSVIIFVIIIVVILLKGVNYRYIGINSISVGEGWYFFYEYTKGESSFIMTFGKSVLIIPIVLALLVELFINLVNKVLRIKLKKS
jgi:hypothetical protein